MSWYSSYGDAYFTDREAIYGQIPLFETDHETADELLKTYVAIKESLCEDSLVQCGDGKEGNNGSPKNIFHRDWYGLLTKLADVWSSRALNALPKDPDAVDEIAIMGTHYTDYNRSRRSIEWLRTHGACMDNIVAGNSTIVQAGRGAFAKRFIPAGGLVGPAPALHMKRSLLNMYPIRFEGSEPVANTSGPPIHQQLLLNYCWGHRNSSLVRALLVLSTGCR